MKVMMKCAVVTVAAFFVFGCGRTDFVKSADSSRAKKDEVVSVSEDDVTAATIARITAANAVLTNCLYRESDKAMAEYRQISSEIRTLPPEKGEQCVKAVIRSILAVPYEHLNIDERLRALDNMGNIMWGIDWPGMGVVDLWEVRMLWLSRIRDVIKYTQSEPNDQDRRNFIAYESRRLENRIKHFERILASWSSLPSSSAVRFYRYGKVTEKEYDIIKTRFESFLGRPIRACEEISQTSIKKVKVQTLEEAQRESNTSNFDN